MKFLKKRSQKIGLPPGSLIHIGERRKDKARITAIAYDTENFEVKEVLANELLAIKNSKKIAWIDVEGLHDVPVLQQVGNIFDLHPLVMEDILNTDQRPKIENYGDYIYIVLKMLCYDDAKNEIIADQVSLVLGKNFVISFQEGDLDVFDPVRRRLKDNKSRVRNMGPDFLAYSLIDSIVDNYFFILEKFGDKVELLEDELVKNPGSNTLGIIHKTKRGMLFLRKNVWPLRELAGSLEREESDLLNDSVRIYLRDIHDHAVYLVDTIETFREMLSGMLDIYLSSVNNRMNEIMKVLTIFATLFMPLTFIAGVYGMNFEFMPELDWRYGYPACLAFMFAVAGIMFGYIRRKKWL